jgi:hypothetical protein
MIAALDKKGYRLNENFWNFINTLLQQSIHFTSLRLD